MNWDFWHQVKSGVELASGWPPASLHVLFGVIGQLLIAALLRRSLASALPWTAVLLFELANEGHDLWFEQWPSRAQQMAEGAGDIVLTMFLPTLLLSVARSRPELLVGRP